MFAKFALAFACGLVVMAAPASATVMQATFTGVIGSGTDQFGEFGAPGADLTGKSFSLRFVYDTMLGTRDQHTRNYTDSSGDPLYETVDELSGGGFNGTNSPVLSTSFSLGSVSQSYGSSLYGVAITRESDNSFGPQILRNYQVGVADKSTDPTSGIRNDFNIFIGAFGQAPLFGLLAIDQPYSLTPPEGSLSGAFLVKRYDRNGAKISDVGANLVGSRFDLVALPDVAPVPLPATGGLWAIGLAGLARLRRKRSRPVTSG